MALRIASKIIGYEVESKAADGAAKDAETKPAEKSATASAPAEDKKSATAASNPLADRIEPVLVEMSERVERPECLRGTTYKIKTPVSEHAMYVTINDMVLNEGTEFESRQPFEIFINSKNLEHYQWIVALTRVVSAVFRKGGDVTFLAEELQAVFDPKGGYWQKGKFMPSLVAELGAVLDKHMREIGMIQPSERALAARKLIEEKMGAANNVVKMQTPTVAEPTEAIPPHVIGSLATSTKTCPSCGFGGLISASGCATCPDCGFSRCG